MSEGPIRAFRFVHLAIRREADGIAKEAAQLSGAPAAEKLAGRIAAFGEQALLHTKGEEKGLFPKIAEKEAGNDLHYLFDHKVEHELLETAAGLARKIASGEDSPAARQELARKTAALSHHLDLHIKKEEEIVLTTIEKHFSPPEQGAIIGQVLSVYSPEALKASILFIFNGLEPDEREAYVRKLMVAMPPPVFANVKGWIKGGLPTEAWADLTSRVPEVAS
jgi:hemerythrin-like domain-containing protein